MQNLQLRTRVHFYAAATTFALLGTAATAETLADHVETVRPYDLTSHDDAAPERALRWWIGDNSAFAICAKCLCVTGVLTASYPGLGIRATSASPTFACTDGSPEFLADAEAARRFMDMTRAQTDGQTATFLDAEGHSMVFELGKGKLVPPD